MPFAFLPRVSRAPRPHAGRRSWVHALVGASLLVGLSVAVPAPAAHAAGEPTPATFLSLLNDTRAGAGLAPLVLDPALGALARTWSLHMGGVHARTGHPLVKPGAERDCERSSLCHRPDLFAAIARLTPTWTAAAENIGYGATPAAVHAALLASPPHLANILGPFERVGIGVATDPVDGSLWVTFDFVAGGVPAAPTPATLLGAHGRFRAVTPQRLADTRTGDGGTRGPLAADQVVRVAVPANADANAAVLNLTATGVRRAGFVTAYPCGANRPLASNLNVAAGETRANQAVVALDATHAVCVYTSAPLDLVVDLTGSFAPSGAPFRPVAPTRLLDTRDTGRLVTEVAVDVRPALGTASAAVATVTVTSPIAGGFVTAWPCGTPLPLASTVNYAAGQTVANLATVAVGADGRLCLHSSAPTHVVVDVGGGFGGGTASTFTGTVPLRLLDTRDGTGAWLGGVTPGRRVELLVAGERGIATGARAVAVNLTVTDATAAGYVVAFPCDQPAPTASNVNFRAGETVATMAVVTLSASGALCLQSSAPASLVADLAGWFSDAS